MGLDKASEVWIEERALVTSEGLDEKYGVFHNIYRGLDKSEL